MLEDKQHGARIEALEDQARQLLADRTDEYEEDAEDIVDEFYPDAAIEEERQERRTFVHEQEPEPSPTPEPQPDIPPAPPADDGLEDVF